MLGTGCCCSSPQCVYLHAVDMVMGAVVVLLSVGTYMLGTGS